MSHCLTTTTMAERLGLDGTVCGPLRQVFTRWDARGVPGGVGGEQIAPLVRLFHLADVIEVHHRAGGVEAAVEIARTRRGRQFDPAMVDAFCADAGEVLDGVDTVDGTAIGVACEGCPPLVDLVKRYQAAGGRYYVCPICFNAKHLDEASLIAGAELQGTIPMWEWIGDDGATTFSY